MGLPIKFSPFSTEILAESLPFINEIGKMLNIPEYSHQKIIIEGHTSSIGNFDKNLILSFKRAASLKNHLISKFDIASDRLNTIGKGEAMPLPNTDHSSPINDRIQLYVDSELKKK